MIGWSTASCTCGHFNDTMQFRLLLFLNYFIIMSLEENHKKIDEEYVHFAVKSKNSMSLKRDSKILDKLGLKFEEVCAFKFFVRGFPNSLL